MSANCCTQHSLLLAACLETTVYTRPWVNSVHRISETVHGIWGNNEETCWVQLIKGHLHWQIWQISVRKRAEGLRISLQVSVNVQVCFNYIGCEGLIPKAPSEWRIRCMDPELFETWAVFQWSMYKVHEQKHFQWMKRLLLLRQDIRVIVQLLANEIVLG